MLLGITPISTVVADTSAPARLTYRDTKSTTAVSETTNFSSVAIGSDPILIVGVVSHGAGTPSSVTVGGTTMTRVDGVSASPGSTSIWVCAKPSGTTATISVAGMTPAGGNAIGITVWSVADLLSMTARDSRTSLSAPASVNLSVMKGGVVVGVAEAGNADATVIWSGLSVNVDQYFTGTSSRRYTAASISTIATQVMPFSATFSSTSSANRSATFASFR